jgi:predicted lipoprotein with Yx(FWY)xxD motif
MRPDLQQDPRPEFGIPVPPEAARARYDDAQAAPQGPWSGGQPAVGPYSGPVVPPPGPYTGGQPAVGPYSGPQAAAPRAASTGAWAAAPEQGYAAPPRQAADPTVRHSRRSEPTAYEAAPAGYDPYEGHPSGPLPVGSGHRRGDERRGGTGRGRRRAMLALIAAAAVVAGAAGYVAIARWGASSPTPAAAPAAGAQVAATSLTGPNLATRETPLGLVATSDGFTVYEYTKDTSKPPKATCTDACATAWPPVLAGDTPWLKGVSADKVGSVDRPDGTKQLTLNGWPLYRYAKDTKPGDTTGNGVGGTWKALNPEGKPVAGNAAPAAAAPAAGAASGGASSGGSASGGSGSGGSASGGSGYQAPAANPAPASSGDSYGGSSGY